MATSFSTGCYATTFNRRHHRAGHLFQNRFKNTLVDEEVYLLELVRDILNAPAGPSPRPSRQRWQRSASSTLPSASTSAPRSGAAISPDPRNPIQWET